MILNTIVDLKNPRWADLASVSKEWQSVIGARTMAKLKLQSLSCFDGFEKIVQQRHLVKHIYLCVELPKYDCTLCGAPTVIPDFSRDSSIMRHAIGMSMSILSTWKTQGPLTLELNAVSCSNTEHWAKNFRFDDDHDESPRQELTFAKSTWHDPSHGWVKGTQERPPSFLAMQQLFGPIILNYNNSVPVTAVTSLLIRRQFRRCLVPSSLENLLSQLVCLTDIIYEPWPIMYTYAFPQHGEAIGMTLPKTLKSLILFRHSVEHLTQSAYQYPRYQKLRNIRHCLDIQNKSISQHLAQTSLRL
ncbi:hypothetical protein HYE67_009965 [Fusarium culmorum]|uniref:Uncharacterized protein n=1 Tax=Fusarium culmorum TaxID=5516 RepID=A0A2T4H9X9_FUSCU|nr:hypothetical protein FCULG_00004906 [Fusarium culmorum]QPC67734.1 hypothetical protein HYE67_009965 [Fusarium culmorum]